MFGFRKKSKEKRAYFFDWRNQDIYEIIQKDNKFEVRKLLQAY